MSGADSIATVLADLQACLDTLPARLEHHRAFVATYRRTTAAVGAALVRGEFEDRDWVERWDIAFAGLYLEALRVEISGGRPSRPWRLTFAAPAESAPLRHLLFGINAHVNYDLPQALLAVISDAEFDDDQLLGSRRRDHERIDAILAGRVSAEDDELTGRRTVRDRLLTPLNRRASRRFLREARRKVWHNTIELQAARAAGPETYRRRLAELEVLSAAKVADLQAPGQVLLRLAVAGFGVSLPPAARGTSARLRRSEPGEPQRPRSADRMAPPGVSSADASVSPVTDEQTTSRASADRRGIAIVTGGGSGIGAAAAVALAEEGWLVVVAGRRSEPLTSLVAAHPELQMDCCVTDVTDPTSVHNLFARTVNRYGRVDLLFNNAGRGSWAAEIDELEVKDWKAVVDVNLTGAFLCTREAFRVMRRQDPQGGRIINNGSISAHAPRPLSVAYTATKHAITGLTKSTALDGRRFGIACGQIDIGNAATDLTSDMAAGILQADHTTAVEPRMDVADVAKAIVYMADLPPEANVLTMTVMATTMPYVGRG